MLSGKYTEINPLGTAATADWKRAKFRVISTQKIYRILRA